MGAIDKVLALLGKNDHRITATAGTYFLPTTTAHTGLNLSMLQINADAVFTTLTVIDVDKNVTIDGLVLLNISAQTIKQGSILAVAENQKITAVTMSSGSAIGIKRA